MEPLWYEVRCWPKRRFAAHTCSKHRDLKDSSELQLILNQQDASNCSLLPWETLSLSGHTSYTSKTLSIIFWRPGDRASW